MICSSYLENTLVFSILQLFVTMKKKVWIAWVDIPCDDNVGSCNYPDVCALSPFKNTECPKIFKDNQIPCKCPVSKVFPNKSLQKIPFSTILFIFRPITK